MRRFELLESSSRKFWEIELAGPDVTVRFGRIGTAGQAKTKTLASEAEARKEHDKLVKEKTGKGYAEVAAECTKPAAVPAGCGAVAPSAAPALPQAAAAAEPYQAAVVTPPVGVSNSQCTHHPSTAGVQEVVPGGGPDEPTAPSSCGASLTWPSGGFQWTGDLRSRLPAVRGVCAVAVAASDPAFDAPLAVQKELFSISGHHLRVLAHAAGQTWCLWDEAEWAERQQRARLEAADAPAWLELCAQATVAHAPWPAGTAPQVHGFHFEQRWPLLWITTAGLARRGLLFMVERALELCRAAQGSMVWGTVVASMLAPLRTAIAGAADAVHDAVIALLDRETRDTPHDRLVRAYLAPHRTDWTLFARADGHDDSQLLLEIVQPVDSALAHWTRFHLTLARFEASALLQVQLHGEEAFPLLAYAVRATKGREDAAQVIDLAMRMQVPALVHLLAELIEREDARAALDRLAEHHPAAALKTVIEQAFATRSSLAECWARRLALREPAALAAVLSALSNGDRARLEALMGALLAPEAPFLHLPPLLREPPWLHQAPVAELPTLAITERATPERLLWTEAERACHAPCDAVSWMTQRAADAGKSAQDYALQELGVAEWAQPQVLAGSAPGLPDAGADEPFQPAWGAPELLLLLPAPAGLAVWNSYPAAQWYPSGDAHATIRAILARFGEAGFPGLAQFAKAHAEIGLAVALAVDSTRLVPAVLHALCKLKKAKPLAIEWLRAHPRTALMAALPQAFGSDRVQRDNAQAGVRWLVANGFEAEARAVAAEYGDTLVQALQALRDADPLRVLPARMPKLPAFFVPGALRRPLLRDGSGALSTAAIEHIGTMLAISKVDAPYAGLAIVRAACTPASLTDFAWDLFQAWEVAGAPVKDNWAFLAVGLLGDDEAARRLAPRIREWPGESQHQRAVLGLDLLAAIGSDVALMHLNGIAGKVKFKALQERAREKIAAVAEARGFTAAELADRLVPDLGLDEDGTLRLDFGPRHFTVAFDEALKPFVRDAQGVRLKDLPKPLKSDDAALAGAATERYKQVKKDAKAVASLQVVRLEMAMVERRRWPAADFRLFFLEHPLMRHLAARLVWGMYDADGQLTTAFRVAEDFSLADADDTAFELTAEASVGIAHVLEMPQPLQAAFGQVFADYEILQPFRQLGRETYALTAEERLAADIKRYAAKVISTGSVMGLVNRGWERGVAMDGGWVCGFSKRVGTGLEVRLELDPGTAIGDPSYAPKQRIPSLTLRQAGIWGDEGRRGFEQLDAIVISELLRDVDLLAPLVD
jgi:predicted DNA-binding WGR domain protein